MAFTPKYVITPSILKGVSSIEIIKHEIIDLPITAPMIASLRESARLTSTHHSTAIEGNRLSAKEVKELIQEGGHFPNREKDEKEVLNYYNALERLEVFAKMSSPIQESEVRFLHGLA